MQQDQDVSTDISREALAEVSGGCIVSFLSRELRLRKQSQHHAADDDEWKLLAFGCEIGLGLSRPACWDSRVVCQEGATELTLGQRQSRRPAAEIGVSARNTPTPKCAPDYAAICWVGQILGVGLIQNSFAADQTFEAELTPIISLDRERPGLKTLHAIIIAFSKNGASTIEAPVLFAKNLCCGFRRYKTFSEAGTAS